MPGVDLIAQRGFGDPHNSYAWGMAWFHGQLYVGTGRYVSCVEDATTDYYFPVAHAYTPYKAPSLHCPRDRWKTGSAGRDLAVHAGDAPLEARVSLAHRAEPARARQVGSPATSPSAA